MLTGIPITTGQHGGCRLRFGPDGILNVGTGDAITGPVPQSLIIARRQDLAGQHRTAPHPLTTHSYATGAATRGSCRPTGHRNVQGLALRPGTTQLWSAEHGPDVDDEVNQLAPGGNYGWDPQNGAGHSYDQSVPMTDTAAYPAAVRAAVEVGQPDGRDERRDLPGRRRPGVGGRARSPWPS